MERSEIIPALEALTASWEAEYGTGDVSFSWSLSNDPEPWVMLNRVRLCRALWFDQVPLEEVRNRDLWESRPGFAFLDYEQKFIYIGPIELLFTNYSGAVSIAGFFEIPNPANPRDAALSEALGLDLVPTRKECQSCCKFHRNKCSGRPITAFPDLAEGDSPKCYLACNDEEDCHYGPGDCDLVVEHLPDDLLKLWEETVEK